MGLTVAGISLGVATFGAAKYFVPAVDSWSNGKELALGGSVVAVVALSFLVAGWLSRPQGDASATVRN